MKQFLNSAILVLVVLTLAYGVIAFGAVSVEFAAPLFGMAVLLAVLWTAKLLLVEQVSWIRSPMHLPVLLFVVYGAIRYFTSPVEYYSRVELFHVGFYALMYFLVACNLHHRRDLTVVFLVLMGLALAESLYGLWQLVAHSNMVLFAQRPAAYSGRASGTYICPNHLAGFLEMVLGLMLARLLLHRPDVQTSFGVYAAPKILEGYGSLAVLAGIVATNSRGSWIAVAVSLAALLIWAWCPGVVSKYIVGALAGACVLVGIVSLSVPSVRERVGQTLFLAEDNISVGVKDATLGQRTLMWSSTVRMTADHPFFGTGPGTWEWFHPQYRDPKLQARPRHAHNDALQLTAEYGLVGLLLVVGAFVCFFWHTSHLSSFANFSDQRAFAVGSSFAVVVLLVHSFLDFNVHIPANALLLITLMALAVGMENGTRLSRRVQMQWSQRLGLAAVLLALAGAGAWMGQRLVQSQRLLIRADDLKDMQEWDKALELYRQAIALDSKMPGAYEGRGTAYVALAQSPAVASVPEKREACLRLAKESYQQSLALNPRDSEVLAGLAAAYELSGDPVQALNTYQRALELDPNNYRLFTDLGLFYRKNGDDPKALEAFAKSMKLKWDQVAAVNLEELQRKRPPVN